MNIQRTKNNSVKVDYHFADNFMNFMYQAIRIYTVVSNGKPLTHKEIVWFCCFVYMYHKGVTNPLSEEALQIYKKIFNHDGNKLTVSNYKKFIGDKGWIVKERSSIDIPAFFKDLDIEKGQIVDFNIRLSLTGEDKGKQNEDSR